MAELAEEGSGLWTDTLVCAWATSGVDPVGQETALVSGGLEGRQIFHLRLSVPFEL